MLKTAYRGIVYWVKHASTTGFCISTMKGCQLKTNLVHSVLQLHERTKTLKKSSYQSTYKKPSGRKGRISGTHGTSSSTTTMHLPTQHCPCSFWLEMACRRLLTHIYRTSVTFFFYSPDSKETWDCRRGETETGRYKEITKSEFENWKKRLNKYIRVHGDYFKDDKNLV